LKFYLSNSLLKELLSGKDRKIVADKLESLIHDGARLYTSVYTIAELMKDLKPSTSTQWRTVLHLLEVTTEEILPLDKAVLELVCESKEDSYSLDIEVGVALLAGMDQMLITSQSQSNVSFGLPLRNILSESF